MIEHGAAGGLDAYRQVVGDRRITELFQLAEALRGRSFQHVSARREGDGISETLQRLVPLLGELGLRSRWDVAAADAEELRAARKLRDALQGDEVEFTSVDMDRVAQSARATSRASELDADVVWVHDPAPIALVGERRLPGSQRWAWRCHLDASAAQPRAWRFVEGCLRRYDAAVFSAAHFGRELPIPTFVLTPCIDPLSPKNRPLPAARIRQLLAGFGIDPDRPIVTQIARFDRLKDPAGVVRAYRMVRETHDCQLVLAGAMAPGDLDAEQVLAEIAVASAGDPDVHVLPLPPGSQVEINALQRGSTVIVQKSLREGFALAVAEALWKGKPVVGSTVGGIPLQILDGVNGFLVSSPEGAAFRIRYLLNHPDLLAEMGRRGIDMVRHNFLLTHALRDHLMALHAMVAPGRRLTQL